jgi:hypothetical protein
MNNARGPRACRRALNVLLWPVGMVAVTLWANGIWPRWVPDLRRLARDHDFRQLRSGAAVWVDRHFELVDESAPWLDRVGRWVFDRCETDRRSQSFAFPPDPPSLWCTRDVTAVYGADGNLPDRLAELRAALGGAGWTFTENSVLTGMGIYESVIWPFHLSGVDRLVPPAGLETIPRLSLDMGVGWMSRDRPAELRTTTGSTLPRDLSTATATYQPLEVGATGTDRLASEAVARHQHAIAIRIGILYYYKPNVNAGPGRLRKRPLPIWHP